MVEYISREAAYPLAKKICDAIDSEDFQRLNFGMRILDWIDDLPAADVRPVRRGKWAHRKSELWSGGGYTRCSACEYGYSDSHYHEVEEFNYCPNCGAYMREEN